MADTIDTTPPAELIERPTRGLPETIVWEGGADGVLLLLDQTLLPGQVRYRRCENEQHVWLAIRELCVRGAPAIGVAAAYGMCLGTRPFREGSAEEFGTALARVAEYLIGSRPTAVNLEWAVRRMCRVAASVAGDPGAVWARMLDEAEAIRAEDAEVCRRIGEHGARLVPENGAVLTHCNAGALATVAYGTALSLMYVAHEQGRKFRVFADETRPLLQGARLTAFELAAAGIDVTVLCDGAAAAMMSRGEIGLVVTGADRIAANGDVANKIGTYGLAIAAKYHGIPFYVAAPRSTFDLSLASGSEIPIEERGADEVRAGALGSVVAAGAGCANPAFDVTPASLVRGIVTEAGILEPVTSENIGKIFG